MTDKEAEINQLKASLQEKDTEVKALKELLKLNSSEISRYGRQIILPQIGLNGQTCLKNTSVLIVGAGGLGCPSGLYLAAAGIGKMGIVDYDNVELNNLHRQVLHSENNIGLSKCESYCQAIKLINSSTECIPYKLALNSSNASKIIPQYDIIVDASDNAPTRYLLNDAAVLYNKPLVSGSAIRFEGQLTVYNFKGGACYRCLYPTPSKPSLTSNCSNVGVLGPVTGVIGSLQAMEVIKIAIGQSPSYSDKMLYFDGESGIFRNFKIRRKNPDCLVCGISPKITELINYESFCQTSATDKHEDINILSEEERISCVDYSKMVDEGVPHVLLDVRPQLELEICCLKNCINIPFDQLQNECNLEPLRKELERGYLKTVVVCRRGNNSQRAVQFLQKHFSDLDVSWLDIKGGLEAWHKEVDENFPLY